MAPFGRSMLAHWPLDPDVTYLNHGTVGVAPRRVLAVQQGIRDEMERAPSQVLLREVSRLAGQARTEPTRLRRAAANVGAFIGARGDDVVFVDNATTGVNAVLRSFPLEPGDDILITDHAYGATAKIATFVARERRAHLRVVAVPYPRFDSGQLIESVTQAIGPRTRIAVLDHVSSESGLIFPLRELAACCRARGVAVLADAAHAPGMLPLDVPSLGVDWYVANLHKWAHAPRSCGFLWADPARQANLHPPVISWGLDQGFHAEFDWVGTRDPSAWLAAPAGIEFLQELNFTEVQRYNHDLAWHAAQFLASRWQVEIPAAEPHVGFMATLPLPAPLGSSPEDSARLRDALLYQDRIEVQVHAAHHRLWIRVSCQVYNDQDDIDKLAVAILNRH